MDNVPRIRLIPIESIRSKEGGRRRAIKKRVIDALAKSIQEIGLQQPISVLEEECEPHMAHADDGHQYQLIAGEHRLEAFRVLNLTHIPAIILSLDDIAQEIWQIDENLCRAELTELECADHLCQRKQLYLVKHPETKQHVAGGVAKAATTRLVVAEQAPSFVDDTSAKTGMSKSSIQRSIQRAEAIDREVRDAIRDIPEIADTGVELDALASMAPEQQKQAVEKVKAGKARTVREAADPTRNKTCPTKAELWWSTMTGTWDKGTTASRVRFRDWIDRQERHLKAMRKASAAAKDKR